jgi:hypothetical protein
LRRVISVHILCLDDCLDTTIMPQPTEITQFIFGQPLRLCMYYRPLQLQQVCSGILSKVVLSRRAGELAEGLSASGWHHRHLPIRGVVWTPAASPTYKMQKRQFYDRLTQMSRPFVRRVEHSATRHWPGGRRGGLRLLPRPTLRQPVLGITAS